MKADTVNVAQLFQKGVRYEVPMFQRPYVWSKGDQWEPFWEDILAVANRLLAERAEATQEELDLGIPEQKTPPHFLGALVLDQLSFPAGTIERRHIIDGQQRLTTLQLLLDAARDVTSEEGSEAADFFRVLTENDVIHRKVDDDRFKVWPSNADRAHFRSAMLGEAPAPGLPNIPRIFEAHTFFKQSIREWLSEQKDVAPAYLLDALRTVLWGLVKLVVIDLESSDNPQIIFETLNARGTPLLASDLIKNLVFQRAIQQKLDADKLYGAHWRPLDEEWWRTEVRQGRLLRPRLDLFFFHWLTMRREEEIGVGRLFDEFRRFSVDESAEATLANIGRYTQVYRSFEESPPGSHEASFFYRVTATQTTTANPLLLYLFSLDSEILGHEQRAKALDAIESWIVRRMLCRLTTKKYNGVFLDLLKEVKGGGANAGDIVHASLSSLEGESQYWPSDAEVRSSVLELPLYRLLSRGRSRMVLEAIEEKLRSGYEEDPEVPKNLTIEHILPYAWRPKWQLPPDIDPDKAAADRDKLIHTLGNLTLVTGKLNPKMSNGPWLGKAGKREALKDHSILFLNKALLKGDPDMWDEESIRSRGQKLVDVIISIWPPAS